MAGVFSTSIRPSVRRVLRALIAITVTVAFFTLWQSSTGRGFLKSSRRELLLQTVMADDGSWVVSVLDDQLDLSKTLTPPSEPHVMHAIVYESAFGRTHLGKWSAWRSTDWTISDVADAQHGWTIMHDRRDLTPHSQWLTDMMSFIVRDIMPGSPGLQYWPDVPHTPFTHNGESAFVLQHRTYWFVLIIGCALCITFGVVTAMLLVPVRRASATQSS